MDERASGLATVIRAGESVRESTGWLLALGMAFVGGAAAMWTGLSLTGGYVAAVGALLVFVVADYLTFLAGALDHVGADTGFLAGYLEYVREFREGRVLYLDSYLRSVACVVLALFSPVAFLLPVPLPLRGVVAFVGLLAAVLLFSAAPMHAYAKIPESQNEQ